MNTVKAKYELSEYEIKDILAEYLGVEPNDISFCVVKMQRDCECVTAVVFKEIEIPGRQKTNRLPEDNDCARGKFMKGEIHE